MENHGKPWKSMENCIVLKLHHFRFVAQITFRARGFLQNFSSIVINCRFHSGIQLCLVVTAAMSRHSIEFVTEPVWSDEPFTKPSPETLATSSAACVRIVVKRAAWHQHPKFEASPMAPHQCLKRKKKIS